MLRRRSLVLGRRIKVRRRTSMRRRAGMLRRRMRKLTGRSRIVMRQRTAFVRVVVTVPLIPVVVLVIPRIPGIVFRRRSEGTISIIQPSLVVASIRVVTDIRVAAVRHTRVHASFARRYGRRMVFPTRCACRHSGMTAEVSWTRCGCDRRTSMILRSQVFPVPRRSSFVLMLNVESGGVPLASVGFFLRRRASLYSTGSAIEAGRGPVVHDDGLVVDIGHICDADVRD